MIPTISFVTIGSACFSGLALAQAQDGYATPQYAAPQQQYGYAATPYQQARYAAPQYQYRYAAPHHGGYGHGYQANNPSSGSFYSANVNAHEDGAYITKNTKDGTWSGLNVNDHTISRNGKHVKLNEVKDKHEVTNENYNHNNVNANAKYFKKGYPGRHGAVYGQQYHQSGYAPHAGYGQRVHYPSGSYYGVKAKLRGNGASFSKNATVGTWSNLHVDDYTATFNDNHTKFNETKDIQKNTTEKYHNANKYGDAKIISKKYGKNGGSHPSPYMQHH